MPAADVLGRIGLPAPILDLARRPWDVIVIGAGHNGLACAAYLARAGRRVLVLEARPRVGGACTLEEPWPGYRFAPCAYVAGLLHPLVVDELDLVGHGFQWLPANAGLFIPFEDGSSVQLWDDEERCEEEVGRLAPGSLSGWRAMKVLLHRACAAVRPPNERDMWIGRPPSRDEIEDRLGGDRDAVALLFEWSMAEYVERYLDDERLQMAYLGQGVIGTNASPRDPGTAYIYFHHFSGRMAGPPGSWGYVKGGMGMVSFILCDVARESGAEVAAGVSVAGVIPGEGVVLEGGERLQAPVVVSNADPRVLLRLLDGAADPDWRRRVESVPMTGVTLKVNCAMAELPDFASRPGTRQPHHLGMINTPLTTAEWQAGFETMRAGRLPAKLWTELYFQSAFEPEAAPPGKHTMSVFAQYVPYRFAEGEGDWESRREEIGNLAIDAIARFCTNLPDAVENMEVLGPPDIERRVGLTGGHIFQGECLPEYMWGRRLSYQTPMRGIYLCGAATHPGGSVIAINGRNAAMEILAVS